MTSPLVDLRREERDILERQKFVIGEIETKLAICTAVEQLVDSPAGKQVASSIEKLRDGYVRSAMAKNDTAPLQRAAALDEVLEILRGPKQQKQALAEALAEEKNQLALMTVKVGNEERLDPSGGIWR